MTSPFTDDATRRFFESHRFFGLEPDQVRIFFFFFFYFLFFFILLVLFCSSERSKKKEGEGIGLSAHIEGYASCRSPSFSKAPYLVFQKMVD